MTNCLVHRNCVAKSGATEGILFDPDGECALPGIQEALIKHFFSSSLLLSASMLPSPSITNCPVPSSTEKARYVSSNSIQQPRGDTRTPARFMRPLILHVSLDSLSMLSTSYTRLLPPCTVYSSWPLPTLLVNVLHHLLMLL